MSACEKCWADKDGPGDYMRLLKERDAAGHACTPEEQAGPGAGKCPVCKRKTLHQHTDEPMCGCEQPSAPAVPPPLASHEPPSSSVSAAGADSFTISRPPQ